MGDENPIRTLGDYSRPSHEGYRNTIELPEGNNVDPNQHLKDFLKLVDSFDLDGSISIWEDLTTRFLAQFFPPRRTAKLRNDILMFQQHHGESLSKAWTHFKDLLQNVPHHGIDLWLKVQIFYDHVNPITRRTIDQSAGDVPSIFDRRLIELENQVQCLMEAHLAPTQPTQVNKITTPYEICNGPHDTLNCTKGPEQACVDYASLPMNEIRGKKFTSNHGPRNFNDAANTWKDKPNFNQTHTQTFTSAQGGSIFVHSSSYQMKLEKALLDFDSNQEKRLSYLGTQLEQQQDDMIGKINLLWKTISKKLTDTSSPENAGSSITPRSIAAISHDEKEELRKKGIKSLSKLLSPKYLSPASIKELNKNLSSPKRVHFVNSIIILSTDSDTKEEDTSATNACNLDLGGMEKRKEELKEQGNRENEMEADMEVEEEESKFETDEEIGEIIEEEEDDGDEDITSIIDRHLGGIVFGKPFIDETGLVYDEEKGTIMFEQGDGKITFKMPYTMEIFKQTGLMGLNTDSIPPSAHEENFRHGKTHYYQSLLIGNEYK
ncbi:MAK10-like protein [Tanacetum coccineum]